MYPSTHTSSGPTTSTGTTTLDPDPLNSSYVTQTDFNTTTKYLMAELKESVKEIIADQDSKIVRKTEEELQTMSLQIKDISSKQRNQAKQFSTNEKRLENMRNNNKISTKFDTEITENEEYFKMKLDEFKA